MEIESCGFVVAGEVFITVSNVLSNNQEEELLSKSREMGAGGRRRGGKERIP